MAATTFIGSPAAAYATWALVPVVMVRAYVGGPAVCLG
jgi:hypothetical protein